MTSARPTVAFAEDEPDLLDALTVYFTREGFAVIAAGTAAAFRAAVAGRQVDVAVLDISMPGEDGLSLARWLKAQSGCALIFATALGRPIDRVIGLDIGADDYVVKPYDLRELAARAKGVIRRRGEILANPPPPAPPAPRSLAQLDAERRALHLADGGRLALSAAEFLLLDALFRRSGRSISRADLAELCGEGGERAVDVRVTRLRKKLAAAQAGLEALIVTRRGEGYGIDPDLL